MDATLGLHLKLTNGNVVRTEGEKRGKNMRNRWVRKFEYDYFQNIFLFNRRIFSLKKA